MVGENREMLDSGDDWEGSDAAGRQGCPDRPSGYGSCAQRGFDALGDAHARRGRLEHDGTAFGGPEHGLRGRAVGHNALARSIVAKRRSMNTLRLCRDDVSHQSQHGRNSVFAERAERMQYTAPPSRRRER
jgi:hypothetical protein